MKGTVRLSKTLIDAKLAFKEGSSSIPDGIVQFLIQNSPSAEVHIIN